MMRIVSAVVAVAVLAAACGSSGDVQPPEITAATHAELSVDAIQLACAGCSSGTLYVRNQLLTSSTLLGDEQPMPQQVRDAIAGEFDNVIFVTREDELDAFGDDGVVDGGSIILYIGPVTDLAPGVAGVSIGTLTARDGGRFEIVQFQWDGARWEHATGEDTGVTVTSAVS